MTVIVPTTFPFPSRAGIASGKPVRGVQITALARAANYLLGRGAVLIPATRLEGTAIAPGSTATYRAQLWQKMQGHHRAWEIRPIVSPSTGGTATFTFTDPSGGTLTTSVLESDPAFRVYSTGTMHAETVPTADWANGPTAVEFTFANDVASTGDLVVEGLSCFELPRSTLARDGADYGVDQDTTAAGLPIFDDVGLSIGGVSRAIGPAQLYDPRSLFHYMRASGDGLSVTGTWAPLFDEGPVIQPSHQFRSETLRPVSVYVYALCDVGTAGEVRVTMASGDTLTLTVTSTTGAWVSGTVDAYAEDLSTADGRRASTDEIATFEARTTSGAGAIYVESISVGETRT